MNQASDRYKVLFAGICSLILSLGIARFSYTPLLPLMVREAGLGLADAGWLAAINYVGYLIGALIASLSSDLALKYRLYWTGMVVAVVATAMMGLTSSLSIWAISRFFAGLSGAAGLLVGSGLIMNWLIRHDQRSDLGVHFSGVGLGVAGSAAIAALLNHWQLGWREQWLVFTAIGCILLVPALIWFPKPGKGNVTDSGQIMQDSAPRAAFLWVLMIAYFFAGFGYVVSATFIVAIVDSVPNAAVGGTLVFLVVGIGAAPACPLWDLIARRIGDLNALLLATALQIAGVVLPAFGGGLFAALVGALLFGATFVGIVSIVLTMAGRYYPTRPAKMMGRMTLAYAIAQVVAPAMTAAMASHFGSYRAGFYVAAGATVLATLLLLQLKRMSSPAGA